MTSFTSGSVHRDRYIEGCRRGEWQQRDQKRGQVLVLEVEIVYGSTEVTHIYNIVTEGTRRQAVAAEEYTV